MKHSQRFMLLWGIACMFLLGATSVLGQTNFTTKVYVADGTGWVDSVVIGKNTAATDDIGDVVGPYTENELPPIPPEGSDQAPDLRIIQPPGGAYSYGQGVGVDIRLLVSDGQKDVYRVKFRGTRPDGAGNDIVISWESGLSGVGPGGFFLTDGFGGFLFPPVAMHEDSSFTHVSFNNSNAGSFVDIVVGDGSLMRTFKLDSIGFAVDSKGKYLKAQKKKNWATDFKFTVIVPDGGVDQVLFDLKKESEGVVSFPGDPGGRLPINISGLKKYLLNFAPPLLAGQAITVEGRAFKASKPIIQKGQWFNGGVKGAKFEVTSYDYQYQRLPMPNIHNIGEEVYATPTRLPLGLSAQVGTNAKGKPIFRNVTHPNKWKDVQKTVIKKVKGIWELNDGPANCLDTLKSKEVLKALKVLEPHKAIRYKTVTDWGNKLVGQLVTLKFNAAISQNGHTPAQGFGNLTFVTDAHPYHGMTVNEIAAAGDSALACVGGLKGGYTYSDLADFIATLNAEFSGPFDTVSFAPKTVATGIKSVAESDIFIGSGLTFAPVAYRDYSSVYDVPDQFYLEQNYPNPFNPTTTIEFSIPEDAIVTLKVYNMLGQEVATLIDREELGSGENQVDFDANALSTGVYYYRIVVNGGEFQQVNKMMLIK